MQRAMPGGGERELLGAAVAVVDGLIVVRLFDAGGTAGAAGLGADGAGGASAAGSAGGPSGVEAFQEAEPDGLFQVAGLGAGGICLGGGLGGEQWAQGGEHSWVICGTTRPPRHEVAGAAVCHSGPGAQRRGSAVDSALQEVRAGEHAGVGVVGEDAVDAGREVRLKAPNASP
jgi:hypothetical protein